MDSLSASEGDAKRRVPGGLNDEDLGMGQGRFGDVNL